MQEGQFVCALRTGALAEVACPGTKRQNLPQESGFAYLPPLLSPARRRGAESAGSPFNAAVQNRSSAPIPRVEAIETAQQPRPSQCAPTHAPRDLPGLLLGTGDDPGVDPNQFASP